jgi:hypothetical protein
MQRCPWVGEEPRSDDRRPYCEPVECSSNSAIRISGLQNDGHQAHLQSYYAFDPNNLLLLFLILIHERSETEPLSKAFAKAFADDTSAKSVG